MRKKLITTIYSIKVFKFRTMDIFKTDFFSDFKPSLV